METTGLTKDDVQNYLNEHEVIAKDSMALRHSKVAGIPAIHKGLEKPCCGEGKTDKQVKAFKEKQKRLRMEKAK